MPEMPEVETVKKQLQKSLVNKKIKEVLVYMDKMVKVGAGKISNIKIGSKLASKKFVEVLRGKKITSLDRRAKFLIIKLSGGYALLIHLRMSGQLIFFIARNAEKSVVAKPGQTAIKQTLPTKHTHVEFIFTEGSKLFLMILASLGTSDWLMPKNLKKFWMKLILAQKPLKVNLKNFTALVFKPQRKTRQRFFC